LSVESRPGQGTRIFAVLPKQAVAVPQLA
jgi:hypothetical protein